MKRLPITLVLLGTLVACDSSDDDASGTGTDPVPPGEGMPTDDGLVTGAPQGPIPPVITTDNYVDLLANVFSVFSGRLYGDEVLTLPGYSDPAYGGIPAVDENAVPIAPPASLTCGNGGTASIAPESDGLPSDTTVAWNFEFVDCQDGDAVLDGPIRREFFESIRVESAGFTRVAQGRTTIHIGTVAHHGQTVNAGPLGMSSSVTQYESFFVASDRSFHLIDPVAPVSLSFASTVLFTAAASGNMEGGFVVSADWTDGKPISVTVTDEFRLEEDAGLAGEGMKFGTGRLELDAGNGNQLFLLADTGNLDDVEITIVTPGQSDATFLAPWTPWVESFLFRSTTGY